MLILKNFVAVDWRAGKDKIYFFFKDSNTYSEFDIAEDKVADGFPREVTAADWHDFHPHAKNLRFGFTTTGFEPTRNFGMDSDILWLFYFDNGVPMVCKYDQDARQVNRTDRVADSSWNLLLPYFDRIVAGTWRESALNRRSFRFILNDGNAIELDLLRKHLIHHAISEKTWPGLAPYKHRIITAVQNDRSLANSHFYVFLTQNEYLRYDLWNNALEAGPMKVDDTNWPGLPQI